MEQLGPTGGIVIKFEICVFPKTCQDNWSLIRIWHERRVLHIQTNVHLWSYLSEFFLEWEIFQRKVVEKIGTHICIQKLFAKIVPLMTECGQICYSKTDRTSEYNAAWKRYALHVGWRRQECRHTFRTCNSKCFSKQQWLRERASLLPYTYIACLVVFENFGVRFCSEVLIRVKG